MTGKYPARLALTNWIGGYQKGKLLPAPYTDHLDLEEVTMAEAFQAAGYTTAFIGKWHLGTAPFYPEHQGFSLNIAGHEAGQPASYFYPYKRRAGSASRFDVPGLEGGEPGEYLTDRLTEEAVAFIKKQAPGPFFLFLSHYAVHTPIQSKTEIQERYRKKAADMGMEPASSFRKEREAWTRLVQDRADYAGMVASVDEGVGRLMCVLEELGILKDTILVFMSDNGGLSTLKNRKTAPTSNHPLRAGKGWLYEGGIREPMIIAWPGVLKGNRTCDEVTISTDFYPTLLELADLDRLPGQHVDGRSLAPLLFERGRMNRKAVFWHFPHYHGSGSRPSGAVRMGPWKLIHWFETETVELYNLDEDPGEAQDLSGRFPEKTGELKEALLGWYRRVGARMPEANPEWRGKG
jgi:arylsulfatase A-like enzyme